MDALQEELSANNSRVWAHEDTYSAWLQRFGSAEEAAARILRDPTAKLAPLDRYLLPVADLSVVNLLGSHGSKAVALALLGAEVTVVDVSPGNARYAKVSDFVKGI